MRVREENENLAATNLKKWGESSTKSNYKIEMIMNKSLRAEKRVRNERCGKMIKWKSLLRLLDKENWIKTQNRKNLQSL